ncbi:MAG TPA: phage holin family protein [Longimicrobiales bacterium]
MGFLIRLVIAAAALWVAVALVPGITFSGPWFHLFIVALVFGFVNAFVRPLLTLLTCPLIILTLGLFVLVLNALMLWLTSALAGALGIAFHVSGFLAAFLGGIVFAIVSALLNLFVRDEEPVERAP